MTVKKRKIIVLAVVAAVLLALIIWTAWGNTALELNTYTISSDRLPGAFDGYRIAHVSDLHNAEMGKDNEKLLDMLREYMDNEENAILISSHIATDLEGLCDEIYMISGGNIVLREETDVLLSEYGVLKVTEEQYEKLEKEYILATKKEKFGYLCLTSRKDFYQENYPQIAIEKGNIDDLIVMLGLNHPIQWL